MNPRDRARARGRCRRARLGPGLCLVMAVAGACTTSGSATPARPAGPANTEPVRAAAEPGAWRPMAAAPIPPASGTAAVWTGRRLVVWGGLLGDGSGKGSGAGAAYDPGTDRWAVLPPAPVAGRFGTSAVWTGREVLFWGGQAGPDTTLADGAAYDPVGRHWRTLPVAPMGPRTGQEAVWTGREVIVWGGYPRCCPIDSVIHDPAAAAYDPATDRWRRIADVPSPWSGDDGTAVSVVDGGRPFVWRRGHLGAYDPAGDRWDDLPGALAPPEPAAGEPRAPSTSGDPAALGATADGEVFTWTGGPTGRLDGLAYRPSPASDSAAPGASGTWRRTAPLDGQYGAAVTAGPPGRIYAAAGQSARVLEYRIGDDRWGELPLAPIPTRSAATLVWTGSELLFWGGVGDEGPEMNGAAWRCC